MAESELISAHLPCENPDCLSSDALSLYSDGHTHCFACGQTLFDSNIQPANTQKTLDSISGEVVALANRGLSAATCKTWSYEVGFFKAKAVQIANYFAEDGQHLGQKLRFADKTFLAIGKLPLLYGLEKLKPNKDSTLVITEGELDALSVSQALGTLVQTISLTNGAGSAKKTAVEYKELFQQYGIIVLAFDNDEQGRKATAAFTEVLPVGLTFIVQWPDGVKDASDVLTKKRASDLINLILDATIYKSGLVKTGEDYKKSGILRPKLHTRPFLFPWDSLINDNPVKGLRKNELSVILAGSGVGKSTFCRELGWDLYNRHKLRVGCIFLEESEDTLWQAFLCIDSNIKLNEYQENPELISDALVENFEENHFNSDRLAIFADFGGFDSKTIVEKLKRIVIENKLDFVILDHITMLTYGGDNERTEIDGMMKSLRIVVNETGVGLIAVSHVSNPKEGKAFEEGRSLNINSARGSGSIKQIADFIIAIERNQQHVNAAERNQIKVRSLKSRITGFTGTLGELTYQDSTGRLISSDGSEGYTFGNESSF